MKPALLVVDVQKTFFKIDPETEQSLKAAIRIINAAVALFRERHLPIICVQHMNGERGLVPGESDFEVSELLNLQASDLHVHKTYANSFNKTSLESELRRLGVDTVIVTGFCAEYCVLSTCQGARDLDLMPIILRGSLASTTPANIPFVEAINDVVSYEALKKALE
jgi:nicotinamidase-related amidase